MAKDINFNATQGRLVKCFIHCSFQKALNSGTSFKGFFLQNIFFALVKLLGNVAK